MSTWKQKRAEAFIEVWARETKLVHPLRAAAASGLVRISTRGAHVAPALRLDSGMATTFTQKIVAVADVVGRHMLRRLSRGPH
jgi:hypothetical protein